MLTTDHIISLKSCLDYLTPISAAPSGLIKYHFNDDGHLFHHGSLFSRTPCGGQSRSTSMTGSSRADTRASPRPPRRSSSTTTGQAFSSTSNATSPAAWSASDLRIRRCGFIHPLPFPRRCWDLTGFDVLLAMAKSPGPHGKKYEVCLCFVDVKKPNASFPLHHHRHLASGGSIYGGQAWLDFGQLAVPGRLDILEPSLPALTIAMAASTPSLNVTDYANKGGVVIATNNTAWPNPLDSLCKELGQRYSKALSAAGNYLSTFIPSPPPPPALLAPADCASAGPANTWAYHKHQAYTTGAPSSRVPPIAIYILAFPSKFFPKTVVDGAKLNFTLMTLDKSLTDLNIFFCKVENHSLIAVATTMSTPS
ncbi:hypothetical protein BDK51DRAFT_53006 [Blyttiomyces helicus]|uniref:Uncharacterized protein n=1 Tax=Blyttiomyces helicus TaxID=388810 RepID=A0A4P9VYI7_9FUNG|nr:hypothetical protein BDK51DRAFT_53006 [Blyttiomyces helicus]|eukprot:RKO84849.1 hypothetical protein BDK51DRAFT_53006 [Blyttiomyces helicus]